MESLHDAYHKPMGIDMRFQVIDLGLLVMTEIADAEGPCTSGIPVDGELLPQVGCRDEGGRYDIVVVVALAEDLVIGLSVVRTEHDADER